MSGREPQSHSGHLQHSVDEEEIVRRLPPAQVLGHLQRLLAFLHSLGQPGGRGRAGRDRGARSLGYLVQDGTTRNSKLVSGTLGLQSSCFTYCDSCRLRPPQGAKRELLPNARPHQSTSASFLTRWGLLSACGTLNPRMEGGWGVYQETTLAAVLSGARAVPPGGYFYTLQGWEQAVCSQNRYALPASHTECDTGCTGRRGIQQGREQGETGGRVENRGWGSRPAPYLLLLARGGLAP